MSWNINYIGTPENIVKAIEANSESLTGKSKEEYDTAMPNIIALVNQNYCKAYPLCLKVNANGHGHDGYSTCNISITSSGGVLV